MANLNNSQFGNLYNFKPAFSSLFSVHVTDSLNLNKIASLQAIGVKLPSETLSLDRDKTTFKYKVRKEGTYQRINLVSVTWREDENYSVKKFHENWLRKVYDPVSDAYVAGANPGLTFQVIMYKADGTVADTVTLNNVIPQRWGDLDFSWGDEPRGVSYTISYYVENIAKPTSSTVKISGTAVTAPSASIPGIDIPLPGLENPSTEMLEYLLGLTDKVPANGMSPLPKKNNPIIPIKPDSNTAAVDSGPTFTQFPGYEFGKKEEEIPAPYIPGRSEGPNLVNPDVMNLKPNLSGVLNNKSAVTIKF